MEMLGHRYIATTMLYCEGSAEEKRKVRTELWG
jgi:hypothetical protein